MTRKRYSYQPRAGHGLPHDPLNAIIGPRPIGWISSVSSSGQHNLAPYSFFNCFNYHPPIIGFASSGWKDSVRNIAETKEFVWNLATRPLAEAMNESSASLPADQDEFAFGVLGEYVHTVILIKFIFLIAFAFQQLLNRDSLLQQGSKKAFKYPEIGFITQ